MNRKPRIRFPVLAGWVMTLAAVAPATAAGQALARQVSEVEDGYAVLSFPARPEVQICDRGLRIGEDRASWHTDGWHDGPGICENGPVRVELRIRQGEVRDVDILRRRESGHTGAVDLGAVSPLAAVDFFLELARSGGGSGRGLEEGVFPVVLADVGEAWKDLLELARDRSVASKVRSSALFWVGQEAADAVTEGLARVARDEEEDQDVREAAVFALSQRPADESVPILMELARTAKQAETRQSAMFWLAQSGDERVVAFFEEILLGRGGD